MAPTPFTQTDTHLICEQVLKFEWWKRLSHPQAISQREE